MARVTRGKSATALTVLYCPPTFVQDLYSGRVFFLVFAVPLGPERQQNSSAASRWGTSRGGGLGVPRTMSARNPSRDIGLGPAVDHALSGSLAARHGSCSDPCTGQVDRVRGPVAGAYHVRGTKPRVKSPPTPPKCTTRRRLLPTLSSPFSVS